MGRADVGWTAYAISGALLLAGCTTHSNAGADAGTSCAASVNCSAGSSYQFCADGLAGGCATGRYLLSDGSVFTCTTCAGCQSALAQVMSWCSSGSTVHPDLGLSPSMPVSIAKTGPAYAGPQADPGLANLADCPDANIEPDDSPSTALVFMVTPDAPTPKIVNRAICPFGPSPLTGAHDVDYFKVDASQLPSGLTLKAEVFYDITYGDLDIAILDEHGSLLASDGTAVTNGCTTAVISSGVYYVVVAGANHTGTNRYQLSIRAFTAAQTCP
jgi:hypothetical protein